MATESTEEPQQQVCPKCGNTIEAAAQVCPHCGTLQGRRPRRLDPTIPMLLNAFLGWFGVMGVGHMVAGAAGTGLKLLLAGWALILMLVLFFSVPVALLFAVSYLAVWAWSVLTVFGIALDRNESIGE